MLWQKNRLISIGNVHSIVVNLNIWTIRTDKGVCGFDYDANKVIWSIEIEDRHPYACKQIKQAGDYVICTFYADEKTNNGWLFAIEPSTGKIAWSRKIDVSSLNCQKNDSGCFYADENHLFIQRSDSTNANLVLDSKTGKTLFVKSKMKFTKILESGSNVIFHSYNNFFKHPKQFTEDTINENILESHYIISVDANKNQLFVIGRLKEQEEQQERLYHIYELDNESFEILNTYALDKQESYSDAEIKIIDNGVVLIYGDENELELIDFNNPENNWTNVQPMDKVVVTKSGVFTSLLLEDSIFSLSKTDGELTDTNVKFRYHYFNIDDYLITNVNAPDFFAKRDLAIYKRGNEENEISYASQECLEQNIKDLIDFETPEKVIRKEQIENALLKVKSADDLDGFYTDLKKIFKIRSINKKVQAFIEKHHFTDKIEGPLHLWGTKKALSINFTYDELLGEGSDDLLFPAMNIGSESGCDFYLMLDSGKVFSPHHDSLSEGVFDVYEEEMTITAFKNEIVKHFSVYDIDQLLEFQRKATPYEIDSKNEKELMTIACEAFSKSPKKIASFIADNLSMEFLSNI